MRILCALICLAAAACTAAAQTYTMTTFAGGALPENVSGAAASLGGVYGIAIDAAGNIFLSLAEYDIVVKLDAATGMLTRVAGNGTRGFGGDGGRAPSAQLSGPTGLALDAAGRLYIADANNHRVRMVADGVITTVADAGTPSGLADIALDPAGNLYFADFYNHVVRRVSGGAVTTVAGTGEYGNGGDNGLATSAQLAGPSGLAIDSAGSLYIAEAYNQRVRKVTNGVIRTVAGTGVAGFSGDKGVATAATLRQPSDVAVDPNGNLYIADSGNNRIRMSASGGVITTVAGSGATAFTGDGVSAVTAGLSAPQRIALDAQGNLYIVDTGRIRKLTAGVIATIAGAGLPAGEGGPPASAQLLAPQGVAVDAGGNVYISDAGTGRVLKVAGGVLTRVAGGNQSPGGDGVSATSTLLAAPAGVAVDAAGNLYIAESQAGRVRRVTGESIVTVAGGGTVLGDNGPATRAQLSSPQAVAVDASGNLLIADLNRVRAVAGGVISTVAGNGGSGYQGDGGVATAAMVSGPTALAVDAAGNLLIADTGNNRVRSVAGGIIRTLAGNGNYGATGSGGTATSATLSAPNGVAADLAGNIYVTDAYRVLKVSNGKLSAIAGLASPQGIAVDATGNVYVAEAATHRVRVLAPAGTACGAALGTPPSTAPAAGGMIKVSLQVGANCAWAVENLPAWITAASPAYGVGATAVALTLDPNPDAPRTAGILVGGQNLTLSQAGTATIVGQILRGTTPLAGVTVALSGAQSRSAVTDNGGYFSFPGLDSSASHTVTPSLAGYGFAPPSLTYSNVTANPTAAFTAWPRPAVTGIGPVFAGLVQAAPPAFAAGEIVALYGTNLCASAAGAAPTLPDRLAACMALVDGVATRLYYAAPGQINAVLPQTLAAGAHQLVVQRYTDTTYKQVGAVGDAFAFQIDRSAMAFLERPEGKATLLLAQYADGGFTGSARPLQSGDTVTLYLTGLGKKAQTFAEGAAPKTASPAIEVPQVTVQGQPAQVLYAGVQPQYPGLDQITVQIPKLTGASTAAIQIFAPSTAQTVRYDLPAR